MNAVPMHDLESGFARMDGPFREQSAADRNDPEYANVSKTATRGIAATTFSARFLEALERHRAANNNDDGNESESDDDENAPDRGTNGVTTLLETSWPSEQESAPRVLFSGGIANNLTIVASVLVSNLVTFATLMYLRQFSQLSRTIAKNSAVITVVNLSMIVLTINRTSSMKNTIVQIIHINCGLMFALFSIIHTVAHIFLLYDATIFFYEAVKYFYLTRFPFEYNSGVILLFASLVTIGASMGSTRKHKYNVFYFSHIVSWTIIAATVAFHSYYLLGPIVLSLFVLYVPRLASRRFVRPCVLVEHIGNQFVVINLKIKNNRLNRWLLLNFLHRNQGNATVWIFSRNLRGFSCLERHPFSVIGIDKCQDDSSHDVVTAMVSCSGDWKGSVFSELIRNASLRLYSCGVQLGVDSVRSGEFSTGDLTRSENLLFVLENVGIASFLAFVRFFVDPKNSKILHDRKRMIRLHYRTDDVGYLSFLDDRVSMLLQLPFVKVECVIYTIASFLFRGKPTIVSSRIDYRKTLSRCLLSPGRHYIYTNDSATRARVERALVAVRNERARKSKRAIVNL